MMRRNPDHPMLLIPDINDIPRLKEPCGLTIGSFDGVHLGHQALLGRLREKLPLKAHLVVFTFSNHPSHHFTPKAPVPLICPPLQKAKLLESYGADIVILIPFTSEFSNIPYDHFLQFLKERLSFSELILGTGATFGKHKEGNEDAVRRIAPTLRFEVEYLPKFALHGVPVSSGRIRALVSQGAFHDAATSLGRPYSLMGHVSGDENDYVFPVSGLCLPPEGIYPVRIKTSAGEHLARAQVSPKEGKIRMELLGAGAPVRGKEVEVIF